MTDSEHGKLTPAHDDWEPEFDRTYPEKTKVGGEWAGLTDEQIVLRQIAEFKDNKHEDEQRSLDDLAANNFDD